MEYIMKRVRQEQMSWLLRNLLNLFAGSRLPFFLLAIKTYFHHNKWMFELF